MSKLLKFFETFFEQDGVTFGPNSISINPDKLKDDPNAKRISEGIQDLWKLRVDEKGVERAKK